MKTEKKYRFLLGGYDLEMLTIKELLLANGYNEDFDFFDRKLKWGAKLSDYKDLFDNIHTFVGIELTKDIPTPTNFIEIDHHNENSNKNSSLEQLADLLKINLTRKQELIAANDKGYIPAMLAIGADVNEINIIRRKDRAAQGVTEKDEKNAELSINNNLINYGNLIIVKSLTDKYSAITDRLFPFDNLIVYNDKSLFYSGKLRNKLLPLFSDLLKKQKAYYGGNDQGFIGTVSGSLNKDEIKNLINIIKKTI